MSQYTIVTQNNSTLEGVAAHASAAIANLLAIEEVWDEEAMMKLCIRVNKFLDFFYDVEETDNEHPSSYVRAGIHLFYNRTIDVVELLVKNHFVDGYIISLDSRPLSDWMEVKWSKSHGIEIIDPHLSRRWLQDDL